MQQPHLVHIDDSYTRACPSSGVEIGRPGTGSLGVGAGGAQTLRTTCLVKGSGSFILCTYPPTKTVLRRRMSIVGGVFRVWGASVVRVGVWRGGWWRARRRADRVEANVRGDAGSDNTCKFRPPGPARVCPPSIPPQLPGRIRTGTSGAQNSMRAPVGGRCRGASLTAPIHQRHESKTHHKDGRARPRASGSGQSVCNERPCEAR